MCPTYLVLASGRSYRVNSPDLLLPDVRATTMTTPLVLVIRLTVLFTFPITPLGTTYEVTPFRILILKVLSMARLMRLL